MKKLVFVSLFAVLMLSLSLLVVSAGMDMEDPALCIAGKWLVVNAAKESAVDVYLPADTPYGADGGCTSPAPGPSIVKDVVVEISDVNTMFVTIRANQASSPVYVTYGNQVQQSDNAGGDQILSFAFKLH